MAKQPKHMKWLVDTRERLQAADGRYIKVWEFRHREMKRSFRSGQNTFGITIVLTNRLIY